MATNPFDIFSVAEITDSINILPNKYGMLEGMNLFPVKDAMSDIVLIEENNGSLALLPTAARGSPGTVNDRKKRKARTFQIPQIPHDDHVKPADVDKLRRRGEMSRETLENFLNDRLQEMKNKHDITLEWLRFGALKGLIVDADGSTIYDLHAEFGVPQFVETFDLANPASNILKHCLNVKRRMEKQAQGERFTGIQAIVDKDFYDGLVDHPKVKAAFDNWQAAQDRLGGDMRTGFTFGGLTFMEYAASAAQPSGAVVDFIAPGTGHSFPVGTIETFNTYVAPADFNETVGKSGQLYYAKVEEAEFQRGYNIHTQSNPLPMTKRLGMLAKLVA